MEDRVGREQAAGRQQSIASERRAFWPVLVVVKQQVHLAKEFA